MARKGVKVKFFYEILFWLAIILLVVSVVILNPVIVISGITAFVVSAFFFEIACPYEEKPQIKSYLIRGFLTIAILASVLQRMENIAPAVIKHNQFLLLYVVATIAVLGLFRFLAHRLRHREEKRFYEELHQLLPELEPEYFEQLSKHKVLRVKAKEELRKAKLKPGAKPAIGELVVPKREAAKPEIRKHELKPALEVPKKEMEVPSLEKKKDTKKLVMIVLILVIPILLVFGIVLIKQAWFYGLVGLVAFVSLILLLKKAKKEKKLKEEKREEEAEEETEEEAEEEEKVTKITAPKYETDFDKLLDLIKQKGFLKVSEVAAYFKIDGKKAEEWGRILESHGLLSIRYPPIGEPRLEKRAEEKVEEK